MPILDDAKTCYVGTTPITNIYAGTQLVWPKTVLAQDLRVYTWTDVPGTDATQGLFMYVWESYPAGPCCGFPSYMTAYTESIGGKLTELWSFGCSSSGGSQSHSYLPPVVPGLIQPNTMVCYGPGFRPGVAGKFDAGLLYYPTSYAPNSGIEIARITVDNLAAEEIPTQFLQNRCP